MGRGISRFDVRFATEVDFFAINDLFNVTFERNRSIEQFRWKFLESPLENRCPAAVVCLDGDKIVGAAGFVPHQLSVLGDRVDAIQIVDVCVHTDYRKCGVNRATMEFIEAEAGQFAELALGFPGNLFFSILSERPGYRSLSPLTLFTKQCQPAIQLRASASHQELVTETIDTITDEYDPFLAKHQLTCGCSTIRTVEYLNWRYSEASGHSFLKLSARKQTTIAGMIIGRIFDTPSLTYVWIYELLALEADIVEQLLRVLVGSFTGDKAVEVCYWCESNSRWKGTLTLAGFHESATNLSHTIGIRLGPTNPLIDRCFESPSWFLSIGDSDL